MLCIQEKISQTVVGLFILRTPVLCANELFICQSGCLIGTGFVCRLMTLCFYKKQNGSTFMHDFPKKKKSV